MNTYCLLDKLKVLVLHYFNRFHDVKYFLMTHVCMTALRSLLSKSMIIHQVSFSFLRILWLVML